MLPSTFGAAVGVLVFIAPGAFWLFLHGKRRPEADLRTSTDIGYVLFVGLVASALSLLITLGLWRLVDEDGYRRAYDLLVGDGRVTRLGLATPAVLAASTLVGALLLVWLSFRVEAVADALYGSPTVGPIVRMKTAALGTPRFLVSLDSGALVVGDAWLEDDEHVVLGAPIQRQKPGGGSPLMDSPERAVMIPMGRIVSLAVIRQPGSATSPEPPPETHPPVENETSPQ